MLLSVCLLLWAACWAIAASAQIKGGMDWVGGTGHLLPAPTWRQLRPRRRLLCLAAAGPAAGPWLLLRLPLPPVRWPAECRRRLRCCWVLTLHRRPVIVAGKLLLLPTAAALARLSASCGLLGLPLNIARALSRCLPLHFLLLTRQGCRRLDTGLQLLPLARGWWPHELHARCRWALGSPRATPPWRAVLLLLVLLRLRLPCRLLLLLPWRRRWRQLRADDWRCRRRHSLGGIHIIIIITGRQVVYVGGWHRLWHRDCGPGICWGRVSNCRRHWRPQLA